MIRKGERSSDPETKQAQLTKDLTLWRRKYDESLASSQKMSSQLMTLQDKVQEIRSEGSDIGSDDNPQMRQVRMLENKLDKAMIKYNEAQSI